MKLLTNISFFGALCAALMGCATDHPHSASVDHVLTPRPVAVEDDKRCPDLRQAVISQLNQMKIEISEGADTILQMTCATRPSGVSFTVSEGEETDWSYGGSYPMVSETTILAYDRDGKLLAVAGAAIAHQRKENMSSRLAQLSLDQMFGQN